MVLSMARVIYEFHYGIPNGLFIDHINGNSLDNQKKNLRAVTPRQNSQNRFVGKSKYLGVMRYGKNQWTSQIKIGNNYKNLGVFDTELEAFNSYKIEVESLGEIVIKKGRNKQ